VYVDNTTTTLTVPLASMERGIGRTEQGFLGDIKTQNAQSGS